jgi:hypothetical protein
VLAAPARISAAGRLEMMLETTLSASEARVLATDYLPACVMLSQSELTKEAAVSLLQKIRNHIYTTTRAFYRHGKMFAELVVFS